MSIPEEPNLNDSRCPRCGSVKLTAWRDLGDEEKDIFGRLGRVATDRVLPGDLFCISCLRPATDPQLRSPRDSDRA